MTQLALALALKRHATFAGFVSAGESAAVEHVRAVAAGLRAENVWLAGPAGTGKSHLLAAACRSADERGARAMYVALDPAVEPAVLGDLESIELLALDEVDRVARHAAWEHALFAVLNARLERGGVVLAARDLPRESGFGMPDLVSRAAAAASYRLKPLDDAGLRLALIRQAEASGLVLDAAAASYLLTRVSRHPGELMDWLDHIDRVTLAEQRPITIPLLRREIERRGAGSG